jgi:acyl-CoA synthetase (AMP-forming)/AMP-acid ligase II/acyl carrier protein
MSALDGPAETQTIWRLLGAGGSAQDSVAIEASGRRPLTHAALRDHVSATVSRLNAMGLGREDRVALVLPNGPETAVAFLSVAAAATCTPLNPVYQVAEFEFYLSDLGARALIVQAGLDSPAVYAARRGGVRVIELVCDPQAPAGLFTLRGEAGPAPERGGFAQADDVALMLHTSGTTARPKLVPLTQSNLCTSARNIADWLALTPADRCLNVMPLFHVHGLVGVLMSSMSAGASVVCTPGFLAPRFLGWLDEFRPTWYSAVPTMHQDVLAQARADDHLARRAPLRFVRSSSAALPPSVMEELERVFDAPVIEAYGMTEASHQVASNPLPPRPRKPGSVGVAVGPQIAIMGEDSRLLPAGETGEVVIRGPSVMRGYESSPEVNEQAFADGWFRTGDQGRLDEEGYLYLAGRIKELINRGGEKIAPREVDEVLMAHPAVAQAATFAMPDPRLGEEVAAAVVLRPGYSATQESLRHFAAERLAHFKVPARVVIVDDIPKGPTGKLQRVGLADRLGLAASPERAGQEGQHVAPRTETERAITAIWEEVLGREGVGVEDDFLELGGDSMLATQVVSRIREMLGVELLLIALFDARTVAGLAQTVDEMRRSAPDAPPASTNQG